MALHQRTALYKIFILASSLIILPAYAVQHRADSAQTAPRQFNAEKIIAFSGISGCGKTTMARILAHDLQSACVTEADENEWPSTINKREKYGYATALLAFRQLWSQQFIEADELRKQGSLVFLDTYFFKIFGLYMDKPGMEWLISPHDPYLAVLKTINALDQTHFPDADCVVLFEVSAEDWSLFLQSRGRQWDQIEQFMQSHTLTSAYIEQATLQHCKNKGIPVIYFSQKFNTPHEQAQELKKILQEHSII